MGNIHISFARVDFNCPHCNTGHEDLDEKLLNRCNKNKCGYTKMYCKKCGKRFGFTYNYKSEAVGFELTPLIKHLLI